MMPVSVEHYLLEGCGRCKLGGTPACKVHTWEKELKKLTELVRECGLNEEIKWGVPCYNYQNKNILIVAAFKEYCSINFFKGTLMSDPNQLLVSPGENSQAGKLLKFTSLNEILAIENEIKAYIFEAVEIEKAGLKVAFKKITEFEIPIEFQDKMNQNEALKTAFEALTPGKQRGYLLHFSQPKQSKTREARIEKCMPKILAGLGFQDY